MWGFVSIFVGRVAWRGIAKATTTNLNVQVCLPGENCSIIYGGQFAIKYRAFFIMMAPNRLMLLLHLLTFLWFLLGPVVFPLVARRSTHVRDGSRRRRWCGRGGGIIVTTVTRLLMFLRLLTLAILNTQKEQVRIDVLIDFWTQLILTKAPLLSTLNRPPLIVDSRFLRMLWLCFISSLFILLLWDMSARFSSILRRDFSLASSSWLGLFEAYEICNNWNIRMREE